MALDRSRLVDIGFRLLDTHLRECTTPQPINIDPKAKLELRSQLTREYEAKGRQAHQASLKTQEIGQRLVNILVGKYEDGMFGYELFGRLFDYNNKIIKLIKTNEMLFSGQLSTPRGIFLDADVYLKNHFPNDLL